MANNIHLQEVRTRITDDFRLELETYRRRLLDLLRQRGLSLTPDRRKDYHYDWLVHFQVKGWTPDEISTRRPPAKTSEAYGSARRAVAKALEDTAKLIASPSGVPDPAVRGRSEASASIIGTFTFLGFYPFCYTKPPLPFEEKGGRGVKQ